MPELAGYATKVFVDSTLEDCTQLLSQLQLIENQARTAARNTHSLASVSVGLFNHCCAAVAPEVMPNDMVAGMTELKLTSTQLADLLLSNVLALKTQIQTRHDEYAEWKKRITE